MTLTLDTAYWITAEASITDDGYGNLSQGCWQDDPDGRTDVSDIDRSRYELYEDYQSIQGWDGVIYRDIEEDRLVAFKLTK